VCDQDGKVLEVIQAQAIHSKVIPPHCWLEDAGGNRLGTVEFMEGIFNYGIVKSDGSRILDARLTTEGGVLQRMKELSAKKYSIVVSDPAFSTLMLAGTMAAIDTVLT
jgi:hypothetical protein